MSDPVSGVPVDERGREPLSDWLEKRHRQPVLADLRYFEARAAAAEARLAECEARRRGAGASCEQKGGEAADKRGLVRVVLEFYAYRGSYPLGPDDWTTAAVIEDGGWRARAALESLATGKDGQ